MTDSTGALLIGKPYDRLMKPRHEAKREMLKGVKEN